MRNLILATFAVIALWCVPARADLTGDQLHWDYYAYGGLYQAGNTWTDPGSGGNFLDYFTVSSDATSITFDYLSSSTWSSSGLSLSPTIANGIAIDLVSGGPFTSVTIDSATNMVGFDSSRVSFTADQIQVDWANLSFDSSTVVKLDVNGGTAVPEPAQTGALAFALVVLAFCQRKKIFSTR
ncbi:MAG TPA: hypothetical protein VLW25_05545 [Bryobacteraceae bacterium]|nr:hypothetical protein [Bryobacteraceae bacterium]